MTWELLAFLLLVVVLVLVLVAPRLARRRRGLFGGSASIPTLRLEVAKTFQRKKKAALAAATAVLR